MSVLGELAVGQGDTVLVTGATGTLGHRVLYDLCGHCEVIAFARDAHRAAAVRERLLELHRPEDVGGIDFVGGDVRDVDAVLQGVARATVVIHAAALKVIGAAERQPTEAIETNVVGTVNVLNAVRATILAPEPKRKVRRVAFVSSDKAVQPANVYGMTKAIGERLALEAAEGLADVGCAVTVARYGNVFGSSGSVALRWEAAVAKGEPLRVTDPEMTRFFFTAAEALTTLASALVAPAGAIASRKMSSVRLGDLAEAFRPGGAVNVVGAGPFEKRHELLLTAEELTRTHAAIGPHGGWLTFASASAAASGAYAEGSLVQQRDEGFTSENADRLDPAALASLLDRWRWEVRTGRLVAW